MLAQSEKPAIGTQHAAFTICTVQCQQKKPVPSLSMVHVKPTVCENSHSPSLKQEWSVPPENDRRNPSGELRQRARCAVGSIQMSDQLLLPGSL